MAAMDGNAARFEEGVSYTLRAKGRLLTLLLFRRINFANATPDELKQLTQACEVFDEADCKARNMDSECFSSALDPLAPT